MKLKNAIDSHNMLLLALSVSALALATTSNAQTASPPVDLPPAFPEVDDNGVDLTSGTLIVSRSDVSAGEGRSLISYGEVSGSGFGRRESNILSIRNSGAYVYFSTADKTIVFKPDGAAFQPINKDGSKLELVNQNWVYTGRDGTVATLPIANQIITPGSVVGPDGKSVTYYWEQQGYFVPNPACSNPTAPGDPPCAPKGTTVWKSRLRGLLNNFGYGIKFEYAESGALSQANAAQWTRKTSSTSVNLNRSPCDLLASSPCSGIPGTQTVSYADEGGGVLAVSDPQQQITRYSYDSTGRLIGVRKPGSVADDVVIAYDGTRVSSVTKKSGKWLYSYALTAETLTTTATDPAGGIKSMVSNLVTGRPTALTNETGSLYRYTYDEFNRLKSNISPSGMSTNISYDSRGNITSVVELSKDGISLKTRSIEYPSGCDNVKTCNQPISITDANLNKTSYSYDSASGGISAFAGPIGSNGIVTYQDINTSYYQRRYLGQPETLQKLAGAPLRLISGTVVCSASASCAGTSLEAKLAITRDGNGSVGTVTKSAGDNSIVSAISTTYDDIGNRISVDGPLAGNADTTQYRYDASRRMIAVIGADPDGSGSLRSQMNRTNYDARGRVASQDIGSSDTAGNGYAISQSITAEYDAADRKVRAILTAGGVTFGVTQLNYDAAGLLLCTAVRMDPAQWGSQTDACVPQTTGSNGPDRVTQTQYFADGRLKSRITGYGTTGAATDSMTYTPNGQVRTAVDGNGNTTVSAYDGFDRPSKTTYQDGSFEQFGYDSNGNVTSKRLRDGQSIGYGYDALNRLVVKDRPNGAYWETDQTYAYDTVGNLTQATDSNGRVLTFSYDAFGRRTGQGDNWYGFGNASYQYDTADRKTRMTWNDGNYVSYAYLATGNLSTIRDGSGAALITFEYDDLGRRTRLSRANGTLTTYAYDPASRLAQLTQDLAGVSSDQTFGFTFNPSGQIKTRTMSNDIYNWVNAINVNRPYGVNSLNQYTSAGDTKFGYDARGNLIASAGTAYTYTVDNQLATAGGVNFAHDPLGRLFNIAANQSVNTTLTYDGSDVIGEIDQNSGGLLRRYVYGPGADEPLVWYEGATLADRRWLHADERGSIVAVSDDAGNPIRINTYDEYGIPGPNNLGRFQYTGQKWLQDAGLYDFKARIYSPTLGRFLQADPIGYVDGMNSYNYVGGDPVNGTDPSGTVAIKGSDVKPYSDAPIANSPEIVVLARSQSSSGIYGTFSLLQGLLGSNDEILVVARPRKRVYFSGSSQPAPAAAPPEKDKGIDLKKVGQCALNSAEDHYGLGGATAASAALASPIPKAIVPPYRVIGSKTTNLLSVLGHFAEVNVPRVTIGGLGSTNLLRIAGRANPYVAAGLLAVDAAVIGYETYQCYNSGGD